MYRLLYILMIMVGSVRAESTLLHPLRLSLCEIEYTPSKQLISIHLKLFLTDVNEAIVFDPQSKELAFCQPEEPPKADRLLLEYLNEFFYVKVNDQLVTLQIKEKKLSGEGDNTALWVFFEHPQSEPLRSLEIKDAVFTDLFFDQSNIVYAHINGESKSLMLNKKTCTHRLTF